LSAFAGLAGVTLVPVAVVAVGALLGRKALKDDKARQLAQRRLQAKNNVRKYADDIMFTAGKDSRDTLSRISRQLREHFALRAEELSTSTSESLAAAQQAIRSSQEGREKRKKEVAGLLEALRQARQLVSAAGVR
ncbi:MAG: dynamin, partial [Acidimicrobiia bacterium]|nr:dynamin [Acidimicrobiia bacterium]